MVEGEEGWGGGEWVTGTEGGSWRDEHWVLFCMLANWTPIKNKFIINKMYDTIKDPEDENGCWGDKNKDTEDITMPDIKLY